MLFFLKIIVKCPYLITCIFFFFCLYILLFMKHNLLQFYVQLNDPYFFNLFFPPFFFYSQHFRSLCAFSQITRSYNIWDFTKANGQKNDHYYYYFQSCCWGSVIIFALDCLFEHQSPLLSMPTHTNCCR